MHGHTAPGDKSLKKKQSWMRKVSGKCVKKSVGDLKSLKEQLGGVGRRSTNYVVIILIEQGGWCVGGGGGGGGGGG